MKFIFGINSSQMNINLAFQNKTSIPKGEYKVFLAARNLYRVFVNGKFIHYGPSRSGHSYLQKDELNIKLDRLENYLTIEVTGSNINNYYYPDEEPLFAISIHTRDKVVYDTDDFEAFQLIDRVINAQRYSFQRTFVESYQMNEDRLAFYKGKKELFPKVKVKKMEAPTVIDRRTPYPTFEKVILKNGIEYGDLLINKNKKTWDNRVLYVGDTQKGFGRDQLSEVLSDEASLFEYEKAKKSNNNNTLKEHQYVVYDFKRTLTGFINLEIEVLEDAVMYSLFDEIDYHEISEADLLNIVFYRNETVNVVKHVLKKGIYNLITFEAYSLRFLKVVILKGSININSANIIKYENDEAYKLKFECEDKELQNIVVAAQNTLAQNSVDILMDCPSRERAGWLCDSYFSGRAEQLFTGENKIEKNFLMNYILSPQSPYLPEGMIPMNYPSDHIDGVYIPNWSMWFVLELYDYYLRTKNMELIIQAKPKVLGLLNYFQKYENEHGLLEDLSSWVFIEWSKANDFIEGVNFPSNMLYYRFLKCSDKLYNLNLKEKTYKLKETIIKYSYNNDLFIDNMVRNEKSELVKTDNISETNQYYAFFMGIATREEFPELFERMINAFDGENLHPSNAFIGFYLRLEILNNYGYHLKVLDNCKKYFSHMAFRTGTLWEHGQVYASLNHGFASYAANLIIKALTGIVNYCNKTKELELTKSTKIVDYELFIPWSDGINIKCDKEKTIFKFSNDIKVRR